MADLTAMTIDELEASMGGGFKHVAKSLGLSSFGINILDIPPGFEGYPEHDHSADGQEELYIPIAGSARLDAGGESQVLEPGVVVRVGPDEKRKIVTEGDSVRIIAVGGTPGKAYGE